MTDLALGFLGFAAGLFACWWDRRNRNLGGGDERGGPT